MPLYKFLPFESVEVITSKLQSFILDINEIKTSTYKISIENLLTNVPELAQQLEKYNFGEMSVARILVTAPNSALRLHNDGNDITPKFIALNWPLLHCNNTFMRWYTADIMVKNYEEVGYGVFDLYNRDTAQLIGNAELTEPALVNINCPHDVDNSLNTARFMLSMRFRQEPFHLFNDHE